MTRSRARMFESAEYAREMERLAILKERKAFVGSKFGDKLDEDEPMAHVLSAYTMRDVRELEDKPEAPVEVNKLQVEYSNAGILTMSALMLYAGMKKKKDIKTIQIPSVRANPSSKMTKMNYIASLVPNGHDVAMRDSACSSRVFSSDASMRKICDADWNHDKAENKAALSEAQLERLRAVRDLRPL